MTKNNPNGTTKALTSPELTELFAELIHQLDRIEFKVTGLSDRVEVLEDVVRVIKTKVGVK